MVRPQTSLASWSSSSSLSSPNTTSPVYPQHHRRRLYHRKIFYYGVLTIVLCMYVIFDYHGFFATNYKLLSQSVETAEISHQSSGTTILQENRNSSKPISVESKMVASQSNRPKHKGRLYVCGYQSEIQPRKMFPEYLWMGTWKPPTILQRWKSEDKNDQSVKKNNNNGRGNANNVTDESHDNDRPYDEFDLLVFGMHGPCANERPYPMVRLMHYFPGTVLFVNGESYGSFQQPSLSSSLTSVSAASTSLSSTNASNPNGKAKTTPNLGPTSSSTPYDRVYQIGPYRPSFKTSHLQLRNSLQVYIGIYWSTLLFVSWQKDLKKNGNGNTFHTNHVATHTDDSTTTRNRTISHPWQWLVDPNHRRHNTGKMGNAVVYLTSNCLSFRLKAARNINTLLPVHTGSKCRLTSDDYHDGGGDDDDQDDSIPSVKINTSSTNSSINNDSHIIMKSSVDPDIQAKTGLIPSELMTDRSSYHHNFDLFYHYKYCLVMENDNVPGYITEKIINAFLGGCLPIYYGTPDVFDIFNEHSFVYYNISNAQPAIDLLQQLESNETLYEEMLTVPILKAGEDTIDEYFSLMPGIGNAQLLTQVRSLMGLPPVKG